jgi:hypothetical protein
MEVVCWGLGEEEEEDAMESADGGNSKVCSTVAGVAPAVAGALLSSPLGLSCCGGSGDGDGDAAATEAVAVAAGGCDLIR